MFTSLRGALMAGCLKLVVNQLYIGLTCLTTFRKALPDFVYSHSAQLETSKCLERNGEGDGCKSKCSDKVNLCI